MGTRPRDIGTRGETAVADYLRRAIYPDVDRSVLRGDADTGDLIGTPGTVWQVKWGKYADTASFEQIQRWYAATCQQAKTGGSGFPFLVCKRSGIAASRVELTPVYTSLHTVHDLCTLGLPPLEGLGAHLVRLELRAVVNLLRVSGYGKGL